MAIRYTRVHDKVKTIFPDSGLAHRYCQGVGIELGAAAHNPFNLPGSVNAAPLEDFEFYKQHQIELCGAYAEIDLVTEDHRLPVEDQSQDYIISSHVVEHLPNLIAAFQEWNRVLRPGGIVFMIFPKRYALSADAKRPLTTLEEFFADWETNQTLDTHPIPEGHGRGGHYHVFSLRSMQELVEACNRDERIQLGWELLQHRESDDKVGNGHLLVYRTSLNREPVKADDEPQTEDATATEEAEAEGNAQVAEESLPVAEETPVTEEVPAQRPARKASKAKNNRH